VVVIESESTSSTVEHIVGSGRRGKEECGKEDQGINPMPLQGGEGRKEKIGRERI